MKKGIHYDISFAFSEVASAPLKKEDSRSLIVIRFMISFLIGIVLPDVIAQLSPQYGARTSEIEGLDSYIEDAWAKKLAEKGSRLWNGLKFRIGKITPMKSELKVSLGLGLTDYKTFFTTAFHPNRRELEKKGLEKYGDATAHLGCNLGVGSILETADSQIILIRRSEHVAEAPNCIATPAGHPEPIHMFPKLDPKTASISDLYAEFHSRSPKEQHELLVHELFDSAVVEAEEECNLSRKTFSDPLFLGIVTNYENGHVPDLEFYIRTTQTMDQLRDAYKQAFAEKWESSALLSRSVDEVLSFVDRDENIRSDCGLTLVPPTAASFVLLKRWTR